MQNIQIDILALVLLTVTAILYLKGFVPNLIMAYSEMVAVCYEVSGRVQGGVLQKIYKCKVYILI